MFLTYILACRVYTFRCRNEHSSKKKLCVRTSSASDVYLHWVLARHWILKDVNTRTNFHQNMQLCTKRIGLTNFSKRVRSGCETLFLQLFLLWSTSLSRREESQWAPVWWFLQEPPRLSPFRAVPQFQLPTWAPASKSAPGSLSLFQPQSEPQAQGCTARGHRLGPGLVRPETIGGHEAVCKAPAKPVC